MKEQKDKATFLNSTPSFKEHPKFEISLSTKFEVAELCEIFFHKYVKYAYLSLFCLHNFLARWSFATVAASAWAVNIPFRNFGAAETCSEYAFMHNIIPSGGCLYAYYFTLTLYAVIVITLCMLDIKEQVHIQSVLGIMRFITLAAIVLYCIVRLIEGGDACLETLQVINQTSVSSNVNVGMDSVVTKFDPRGWLLGVPIFAHAFIIHHGIPSLTHPVKQKNYLHWLVASVMVVFLVCYLSVGIVVTLWFRESIQETCTLNWVSLYVKSCIPYMDLIST